MIRHLTRAATLLAVLVVLIPNSARAGTDNYSPAYAGAVSDHYEQYPTPKGRAVVSTDQSADVNGNVTVSATVDGKLGAATPLISSAYAGSVAGVKIHQVFSEPTARVTYTVHLFVRHAEIRGGSSRRADLPGFAYIDGIVGFQCECGAYGSGDELLPGAAGETRIDNQSRDLTITIEAWGGDPLPSPLDVSVGMEAFAYGGFRAGTYSASLDATITGIDAAY
ncbi:MAG: hypothetical protein ABR552_06535 [Actinomycetota bacterium]